MAIKSLPEESVLLAKIAVGDQYAFKVLFEYYQQYVFTIGRKLTKSDELAEEIVQDIFLKIWFGRDKLEVIENFGGYLNRLVRNNAFNVLRHQAIEERAKQEIELGATEFDGATEQAIDYHETLKILEDAVSLLPSQQKQVYNMCHQEGLKYEEAAQRLNISSATVHYHMKLAVKAIREHFKKNAVAYPALLIYFFK